MNEWIFIVLSIYTYNDRVCVYNLILHHNLLASFRLASASIRATSIIFMLAFGKYNVVIMN